MKALLATLTFSYIFVGIFYLFPSGLPQIADWILASGIILGAVYLVIQAFEGRFPAIPQTVLLGGLFALYALCVNMIYFMHLRDGNFLYAAAYYPYNLSVFLLFVSMLQTYPDKARKVTRFALIAAFLVELAALSGGGPLRAIGTFNNPNQFGYFLLLGTGIYALTERGVRPSISMLGVFVLVLVLTLSTVSRGGIAAFAVMSIFLLGRSWRGVTLISFLGVGFIFVALAFVASTPIGSALLANPERFELLQQRFLEDPEVDPKALVEERGYLRPYYYPQYLITGAGEGAFHRFAEKTVPYESHSTFITVIFSYGLIGSLLFFGFLYSAARKASFMALGLVAGIMLYSLTHQGLRFTYFWVFLAYLYVFGRSAARHNPERPELDKSPPSQLNLST